MQCGKCGNALVAGSAFCSHCGALQSVPPQNQPQQTPQPQTPPAAYPAPQPSPPVGAVPPQMPQSQPPLAANPAPQPMPQPQLQMPQFQPPAPLGTGPIPPSGAVPPPVPPQQAYRPPPPKSGGKVLKIILFAGGGLVLLAIILISVLVALNLLAGGGLYKDELADLGFECQAETLSQGLEDFTGDKDFDEEFAKRIKDSDIAQNEYLECQYDNDENPIDAADKQIDIDVALKADMDSTFIIMNEVMCQVLSDADVDTEQIDEALSASNEFLQDDIPAVVVEPYFYLGSGNSASSMKQFKDLLEEEDIEYTAYELQEFTCDN